MRGTVSLDVESLTGQFTMLAEDHARVDPRVWQRAGRAINQRERLRMRYQRFDGATRDYLLEPDHMVAYHGTCQRPLSPSRHRRSFRVEHPEKLRAKEAGIR